MRQVAALAYRRADNRFGIEVLLITSRTTGRWIVPKGGLDFGSRPKAMAAREAYEEAGVTGKVGKSLGQFDYLKVRERGKPKRVVLPLFPLRVECVFHRWPEQSQRRREWFEPDEAARLVEEDKLGALILDLAARPVGKRLAGSK